MWREMEEVENEAEVSFGGAVAEQRSFPERHKMHMELRRISNKLTRCRRRMPFE
jgi:hypothetical protein